MHADKIIVLDGGRAVGLGTHDELLKTSEIYREVYESQYTLDNRYSFPNIQVCGMKDKNLEKKINV